jgi:VRR-NUC domain
MAETNSNVTSIDSKQAAPAAKFQVSASLDGFPVVVEVEGKASDLRAQATEAEIQDAILDYLKTQRIPHSITNAVRSYNGKGQIVRRIAPGWPDITGCLPVVFGPLSGVFLAIECKSAKGKLRPDQAATLHALYQAGALVVVARSVDDVVAMLEAGKATPETLAEITATLAKEGKRKKRRRANKR